MIVVYNILKNPIGRHNENEIHITINLQTSCIRYF